MARRTFFGLAAAAVLAAASPAMASPGTQAAQAYSPPMWSAAPFVAMLLAIAVLPLAPACRRFWHSNLNKLLLAVALCVPAGAFYYFAHPAAGGAAQGAPVLGRMLHGAIVEEYVPFIILLLSLYVISGGIVLRGDLRAKPATNTAFLAAGSVLASIMGTTGAAMLLIRPLLQTNSERRHVHHTVIFFIFIVCNTGGCLLPTGDPPLFLGYLMGVPFLWTLNLAFEWAVCNAALLAVYFVWDCVAYRKESPADIRLDTAKTEPLSLAGRINFVYLLGVVLSVAVLVPGRELAGFVVPHHLREGAMLAMAGLSMLTTRRGLRAANRFTFAPIAEVAALFLGIFITMQPPMEMLHVRGPSLGLTQPWQFFWATGALSSFLDNAPTYVVFFQAADSLTHGPGQGILALLNGQYIRADLLAAVSLGAVFMGANTYIGNGPNFMVKAIAEERGIKMPNFLHYMLYSGAVLIPLFILISLLMAALR